MIKKQDGFCDVISGLEVHMGPVKFSLGTGNRSTKAVFIKHLETEERQGPALRLHLAQYKSCFEYYKYLMLEYNPQFE